MKENFWNKIKWCWRYTKEDIYLVLFSFLFRYLWCDLGIKQNSIGTINANFGTCIPFMANENIYIKYISQALVNNTEKAKEIGE